MPGTSTRFMSFERLAAKGADGEVIVKLMMACNDMTIANLALTDWKQPQPQERRDLETGARMYFVRIELAHLYEGLKIIKEVQASAALLGLVQACDVRTRDSFAELEQYVEGGARHQEIERMVGRIRHTITFHYYGCGKPIRKAIASRAARPEARQTSITRGSSAHRWRFSVADDVIDSIVVRDIWSAPFDSDVRKEVDEIAMAVHSIELKFLDFCGEYIWKYCSE